MISSGALTDPGGLAEGTADGCSGLSGGWHAAPVATAGPPCRSALPGWAEWSLPEPGWQMGRQPGLWPEGGTVAAWAMWEKAGQAENPPWSGCCPTEQRLRIPQLRSVILGLSAHQPVGSLEPRKEVTHWVRFGIWQRFILGVGRLGFEAYHWGPKLPWALALQNQRIKVRHSGTDRKWFSSGEWNGMVIYPS